MLLIGLGRKSRLKKMGVISMSVTAHQFEGPYLLTSIEITPVENNLSFEVLTVERSNGAIGSLVLYELCI